MIKNEKLQNGDLRKIILENKIKKYGTSWTDSDSQSVKDENEAPTTESVFENKQVESPVKVDSPVKMDPKPFSFMSKKSDEDVKSAPTSTPLFSFKPKSPKKDENSDSKYTTPKFSFNPTKPENGESKVPTFSFSAKKDDTKDEKSDDKPAGGFFSKLNNSNSGEFNPSFEIYLTCSRLSVAPCAVLSKCKEFSIKLMKFRGILFKTGIRRVFLRFFKWFQFYLRFYFWVRWWPTSF